MYKGTLTIFCVYFLACASGDDLEQNAKLFLNKMYTEYGSWIHKRAISNWNYATNISKETLAAKLEIAEQFANFSKQMALLVDNYPWRAFKDPDLRRQFQKLTVLESTVLPDEEYKEMYERIGTMQNIYSTAKICDYKNSDRCDLSLEPELTEILATSHHPPELQHIWVEWRNATGKNVRKMFERYVELSNKAARLNNFTDTAAFWLDAYEAGDIIDQIDDLWEQIKPLYLQIHAFARYQLYKFYGDDFLSKNGPIPAHLLRNMWSQKWTSVYDISAPYPAHRRITDVSEEMVKQEYDSKKMFRLAESCFTSMNMSAMLDSFWQNSIIDKPKDRDIVCHASAWYISDSDFRVKMCTRVNMENLMTVHHEMGHIQYYIQYRNQPIPFKGGANPGFHEAVGDVMALSVSTPKHLHKIGLLKAENLDDPKIAMNDLYLKALDKVVFLPYAYVLEKWRWGVFQGKIRPEDYNCEWWKLREKIQGIEPPVDRTENDFDPGAKYHVVANVEYLRYFVSHIIQFQFHRALCIEAGEYDPQDPVSKPLHNCDVTYSTKAGNLFKSMLQMGESKPWQDAMEKITGQRKMDASAILEYFQPLYNWLKFENLKNNVTIGWEKSRKNCIKDDMTQKEGS